MSNDCNECDKHCDDHSGNITKIALMQEDIKTIQEEVKGMQRVVTQVHTKLTLGVAIIGLLLATLVGMATYSGQQLTEFKREYYNYQMATLHQENAKIERLSKIEERIESYYRKN